MADQTVRIEDTQSKAYIAFEMAKYLWLNSKDAHPDMETKEEFLDLVKECMGALNTTRRR